MLIYTHKYAKNIDDDYNVKPLHRSHWIPIFKIFIPIEQFESFFFWSVEQFESNMTLLLFYKDLSFNA